jgi:predicted nucleic acid-binding protein
MANKIFLDLNIVIDILDNERVRHEVAKECVKKAINDDFEICISSDMVTNLFYICRKKFDCHKMLNIMALIRQNFTILEFTEETIDSALDAYRRLCDDGKSGDFEDLLQLSCAAKSGCEAVISEDRQIKEMGFGVKIFSSQEFLKSTLQ